MKAAQINTYGDVSIVQVVEIERPRPAAGQVLVEVHAASLNPFDSKVRSGAMKEMIPLQFPVTLGGDIAGIVQEVGKGVQGIAVGDRVYGQANVVAGNSGAFAEYAVTGAGQLAHMPEGLSFAEAAALPLVGVSALQALQEHLEITPGQKVFIHGGAGGIGAIAIQMAKYLGAYVAVTATGTGIEAVKRLGADEAIDYKVEDFTDRLHDYDAVFDTVGGADFVKSFRILKNKGRAVSMTGPLDEAQAAAKQITALTQATHVTTKKLDALCKLVEAKIVGPHVGKVFALDEVREAFRARESGQIAGKVVLEIK